MSKRGLKGQSEKVGWERGGRKEKREKKSGDRIEGREKGMSGR